MSSLQELESRAKALARQGIWGEEAIQVNTAIVELDEGNYSAYNRLSQCYMVTGRYEAARDASELVLALAPPEDHAARNVATNRLRKLELLLKSESETGKMASYEEAFAAGQAAKERCDFPRAIAAFQRAYELRPSIYPLNALAATYRDAGQSELSEHTYKRALEMADNPVSWVGLAGLHRAKGQLEEAKGILLRIAEQYPNDGHAWRGLAGVYGDLGQGDLARKCWNRSEELGARS